MPKVFIFECFIAICLVKHIFAIFFLKKNAAKSFFFFKAKDNFVRYCKAIFSFLTLKLLCKPLYITSFLKLIFFCALI